MFENLKIKKELKKRFNFVYDLESENTYIKDVWENKYHLVNNVRDLENFFKYLIKIYVGDSENFWLHKYSQCNCIYIEYKNIITDHFIILIEVPPSIFKEKRFKVDCLNAIETAKKLKKKFDENKDKII